MMLSTNFLMPGCTLSCEVCDMNEMSLLEEEKFTHIRQKHLKECKQRKRLEGTSSDCARLGVFDTLRSLMTLRRKEQKSGKRDLAQQL